MKICFRNQAIHKRNSEGCVVTEHPLGEEMIDFAIAKVTGREPDTGYARNTKSKEVVYVYEGNGKVVINGTEHLLQAGDAVLIEPGEHFYWDGQMVLGISCTPAWAKAQYELVEDFEGQRRR